jgi:hypothetical protein
MVSRTAYLRDDAAKEAKEKAKQEASLDKMEKSEAFSVVTGNHPQKVSDTTIACIAILSSFRLRKR